MAGITRKSPRNPIAGLTGVALLGLLAAFFAWQGAEPLWLALGRGEAGTATVTRCDPVTGEPALESDPARNTQATSEPSAAPQPPPEVRDGLGTEGTYRCVVFTADSSGREVSDVDLLGAGAAAERVGEQVPARMLSLVPGARAYAGPAAGLHLRWGLGLALVLACGAGIAWVSGATRLEQGRYRWLAVLLSFAWPVVLTTGFLVASF